MNSQDKTGARYPEDDEKVARLLQGAGRRAPLPQDTRDRMEQTFRAELAAVHGQRRRNRTMIAGSLAASVLVAALLIMQSDPVEQRQSIASVTREQGEVSWQWQEDSGPLQAGNRIQVGDRIETGSGSVSLIPDGSAVDIRLGGKTVAEWRDQHTLLLHSGIAYVDSDPNAEHFPLVLLADGLRVEHVGTQYMLTRQADELEVAVREGSIAVDYKGNKATSRARNGEAELLRLGGEQPIERITIAPFDDRWQWTTALTPALDTDGLPLRDFFSWFSRQTGYTVDASGVDGELLAETLVGQYPTSDAFRALGSVEATNPFTVEVDHERGVVMVVRNAR